MLKICLPFIILLIISGCKTGEIDEISNLNEEIRFEVSEHLYLGNQVKAIAFAGPDHWFFASGNEIMEVINSQQKVHTASSPVISMAWNKKEEALWFGTQTSGLGRLKNGQISYFTKESHGLPRTEYIRNVNCDENGEVWFNTSAHKLGGLGRYKEGNFQFYTPENSLLPDNLIKSISIQGKNVYVATGGYVTQQKLIRISGENWELLPVNGYYLMDMAVDRKGIVYIIDDYSLSSAFPNNSGIFVYDGQEVTKTKPEMAPGYWYNPYLLTTDQRNYLWVAQFRSGAENIILQVYNGKEWIQPTSFPDVHIHCMAADKANTLWIGTGNGILKLKQ